MEQWFDNECQRLQLAREKVLLTFPEFCEFGRQMAWQMYCHRTLAVRPDIGAGQAASYGRQSSHQEHHSTVLDKAEKVWHGLATAVVEHASREAKQGQRKKKRRPLPWEEPAHVSMELIRQQRHQFVGTCLLRVHRGLFGFAHKTIWDFFVAWYLLQQLRNHQVC